MKIVLRPFHVRLWLSYKEYRRVGIGRMMAIKFAWKICRHVS